MVAENDVRGVAEQHLGRSVGTVREIPGGFGHFTYVVDEDWVFRFPRTPHVAKQDRIEQRILPLVERSVTFAVPRFDFGGSLKGLPYVGYRLLPGRPLRPSDVPLNVTPSVLAEVVFELHPIDVSEASSLLGTSGTATAWEARYRYLRSQAATELVDVLSPALSDSVDAAFDRFFEATFRFEPVLVHGDLGTSHILVNETEGLVGLLDFEAVTIGDPAIDFVGFIITLGPEVCDRVISLYAGLVDNGFRERVLGYWWIGWLYAILHGVDTTDQATIESGIAGLDQRLTHLSRLTTPET